MAKDSMSHSEIMDIIGDALLTFLPQPVEVTVTDRTNIVQDLGLDSLAVMNFVMAVEDSFDISVPLDRIAEVQTVGDLVETVSQLLAGS